jgi:ribosome-associated protein
VRTLSRPPVRDVPVRPGQGEDGIRLGQLLKLAGLVDSGADAKAVLEAGEVTVGGRVETRRGRQLGDGDVIALGEARVRVVLQR